MIGYIIGCLLSMIFWKFDRQAIFLEINELLSDKINKEWLLEIFYSVFIFAFSFLLIYIKKHINVPQNEIINNTDIYNLITAFIIIDISTAEHKALSENKNIKFDTTISLIAKAAVCGFTAPLFYLSISNNICAVIISLIFLISNNKNLTFFNTITNILLIVPSVIVELILYFLYLIKFKKTDIYFAGKYLDNLFKSPLLNVNIISAYIESTSFYHHYSYNNYYDVIKYGNDSHNLKMDNIKHYLNLLYIVCLIIFSVFFIVFCYREQVYIF
jgi:hypothetical protein